MKRWADTGIILSSAAIKSVTSRGVSRAAGNSDVTQPGTPKGKRGYMAPEQAIGRGVGPAADIFSLGRVVSEAADVNCGPALRAVIEKATAEKPQDRWATASELAAAGITPDDEGASSGV